MHSAQQKGISRYARELPRTVLQLTSAASYRYQYAPRSILNSDLHVLSPSLWTEIADLGVDLDTPRPDITRERLKPDSRIPNDAKLRSNANTLAYLSKTTVENARHRLLKHEHTT
jgi:hypothetical protein